jgi:hypothetical protein
MRALWKRPAEYLARASALPAYRRGQEQPGAGCRAGTCNPATTKYPRTASFLERPEKGGAVEFGSADTADCARLRQLARHDWSRAPAHDELGLSVGGDDQLLSFRQAINQARIVVKFPDRNGLHDSVRQYRLTLRSCEGKRREQQRFACFPIGVQGDHAGRHASAASRSSYTSLRYCRAWPGGSRASVCRRRRASRGVRCSFEEGGPDAPTGRNSTDASPFRMRMPSPYE